MIRATRKAEGLWREQYFPYYATLAPVELSKTIMSLIRISAFTRSPTRNIEDSLDDNTTDNIWSPTRTCDTTRPPLCSRLTIDARTEITGSDAKRDTPI